MPPAAAAVPPPPSGAPATAPIPVSGHAPGGMGMPGGYSGEQQPGGHPGEQQTMWYGAPGYGGQPQGYGQVPPYAPPPAGPPPARRTAGRVGKALGIGLLALLLAGGGGAVGGAIVHAADHDGGPHNVVSSSNKAAPVVMKGSLADIANQVRQSVVSIQTEQAEGSGVVLSADGYVLTNNHVVATARGNTVSVLFADGNQATATIIGTDQKTDLAVIKAQGVSGLKAASFGDSDALAVGDWVLAVGSPLGLDGSVTAGIVSALNRTIQESGDEQQNPFQQQRSSGVAIAGAIQTDAAINPGNSGGALVNTAGDVVGINTAIATSGSSEGNVGIGFAIPSNRAKQVAEALMNGHKVSHPFLGVTIGDAEGNGGAVVGSVTADGPAAKAGVKEGDIITKAGDTAVHNANDLLSAVQGATPGDSMKLTINRDGSTVTVTVTIGES